MAGDGKMWEMTGLMR